MTIKQCKCKHEEQYNIHGKNMRVHTTSKHLWFNGECWVDPNVNYPALFNENTHGKYWAPITKGNDEH